jgi:hypothetical protein
LCRWAAREEAAWRAPERWRAALALRGAALVLMFLFFSLTVERLILLLA